MSPAGESAVRSRFAAAPVARFASVRPDGSPHLVPVTFALVATEVSGVTGDEVVFAIDSKPKTTTALQRLANIAAEPRVSFLVDRYDAAWAQLWWVRADGVARILAPGTEDDVRARALDALALKYPQYRASRPEGAVVSTHITRWADWAFG